MTEEKTGLVVKKLIVVFDICSSTSILEDLLRSDHEDRWKDLIQKMRSIIDKNSDKYPCDLYKFLGDGWITIFPPEISGEKLLNFCLNVSKTYQRLFLDYIDELLSEDIPFLGVTFGIDKGRLMKMRMKNSTEYVGRPINVASRLQSSAKDSDSYEQYRVLISQGVFADFVVEEKKKIRKTYEVTPARRSLRNISGGEDYRCTMIDIKGKIIRS